MGTQKKTISGFTAKYNVTKLIYFELFDFIDLAIAREKQIKKYSRENKFKLIHALNPNQEDLYQNDKIVWDIKSATKVAQTSQLVSITAMSLR